MTIIDTFTNTEITKQTLIDFLLTITPMTPEEQQAIMNSINIKTYKKGTYLLKEGETPTECYMNFKGCVRQFYLIDGEEKTTQFFMEGDSIAANMNNENQSPSKYYLECLEDTTLSVSTGDQELELYRRFPRFESLCRIEVEKKLGESQEMLAAYITTSPEERYRVLLETRPELLLRVPQYQLASFIGVKPESLSRIRKRISLKK